MRRLSVLVVVLGFIAVTVVSPAQQAASSAVPNLIRYGAALKDAQGVTLGSTTVGVTFSIYKQQDGGAAVWMETQNVTTDAGGNYNVLLGSTTATGLPSDLFSQQEQRWLEVEVQGEAAQPRVMLVSVPYALKAHEAETLGGKSVSEFMLANGGNSTATAGSAAPAGTITGSGTGGYLAGFTGSGASTTIGNVPLTYTTNSVAVPAGNVLDGTAGEVKVAPPVNTADAVPMANSCGSAPICVTHTNGPATSYFPSSNTNAARGTALLSAFAAATNGDSVHLAAGTFDLGTSALDQSVGGTGCVNLLGSGKYSTVITSNYRSTGLSYPVVRAGSDCTTADLTITNTGGTSPNLGSVWGAADAAHNHPFVHAVVRNVAMNGNADGIYVAETGASYEAYNLTINTTFDLVTMSDPAGTYSIYDSVLDSTGTYTNLTYPHCVWTPTLSTSTTVINVFNTQCISATNHSVPTFGYTAQKGTVLSVYGGSILTAGGTTNLDLQQTSGGVLNITAALQYSPAKTNGTVTSVAGSAEGPVFSTAQSMSTSSSVGNLGKAVTMSTPAAIGTYEFRAAVVVTTAGSGGTCSQGSVGLQLTWTDADTNVQTTGTDNVTFQSGSASALSTIGDANVSGGLGSMSYSIPLPIHAAAGTSISYQPYQSVASNCATPPVITIRPALRYLGY
jgi:hypothetical protein